MCYMGLWGKEAACKNILKWFKERIWSLTTPCQPTDPLQLDGSRCKDRIVPVSLLFPVPPKSRTFFTVLCSDVECHRQSGFLWTDTHRLLRRKAKALVYLQMAQSWEEPPHSTLGSVGRYRVKTSHSHLCSVVDPCGKTGWSPGRPRHRQGRAPFQSGMAGGHRARACHHWSVLHWTTKGANPKAVESFQCPETWG